MVSVWVIAEETPFSQFFNVKLDLLAIYILVSWLEISFIDL